MRMNESHWRKIIWWLLQCRKIRKEENKMDKNTQTLTGKFECCGKTMVTVIIEGRAACVMPELEYNRIIETERKARMKNKVKVA